MTRPMAAAVWKAWIITVRAYIESVTIGVNQSSDKYIKLSALI